MVEHTQTHTNMKNIFTAADTLHSSITSPLWLPAAALHLCFNEVFPFTCLLPASVKIFKYLKADLFQKPAATSRLEKLPSPFEHLQKWRKTSSESKLTGGFSRDWLLHIRGYFWTISAAGELWRVTKRRSGAAGRPPRHLRGRRDRRLMPRLRSEGLLIPAQAGVTRHQRCDGTPPPPHPPKPLTPHCWFHEWDSSRLRPW